MTRKQRLITYIMLFVTSFLMILFSMTMFFIKLLHNEYEKFLTIIIALTFIVSIIIFIISSYHMIKEYLYNQKVIKKSFNSYIDNILSKSYVGVLIFNSNQQILWCSKFMKDRFGREWVGNNLDDFLKNINLETQNDVYKYEFKYDNSFYEMEIFSSDNCLLIKDISIEKGIIETYNQELPVLGELEIDNYQLLQSSLSEEQLFIVQKEVISILDNLMTNYNLIYRQYTNGKFIILTNDETLKKLEKLKFEFFNSLHNILGENNSIISVSLGFAKGWNLLNKKIQFAKKALLQSQNRGGDQITIFSDNEPVKYYGTSSEILADINRTKIKTFTENFKNNLLRPEINKVIIYGHQNADLDAIGSAYGIYKIVKDLGKDAYICSSTQDFTTKNAISRFLKDIDTFIIKPQNAARITDKDTLVVLVDNSQPDRTDFPECVVNVSPNNVFIIDHHRQGRSLDFCSKNNAYIDSNASSAAEIITEMIMFLNVDFRTNAILAQMLLNGIYLDTLQFQKKVSSRTFEAAGWLENKGAISSLASEVLKIDNETYKKVLEILDNLNEVKKGYFLAYKDIPVSNDIISIASEEILRISGRKASFVVAKEEKTNNYKLSARGLNTNVQLICEQVGGGGHFGTAAASTNEPLDVFIDNIIQAIVSEKDESNIN